MMNDFDKLVFLYEEATVADYELFRMGRGE
jgi:hypothetical protein